MATCIHSSRSCLPPFYTIPVFPLLNRKIFHLLVHYYNGILYARRYTDPMMKTNENGLGVKASLSRGLKALVCLFTHPA